MICPKCHGEMRIYERSGVTVDQCTECRGIFLDRGELERLFEAEANWNSRHAPPVAYAPPAQPGYGPPPAYGAPPQQAGYHGHYRQQGGHHGHYRQQPGYHGHYHQKRRRGFLGELFD